MPVVDTCVLLTGLAFPRSDSGSFLQRVSEGKICAVISNTILSEALDIASKKAPHLIPTINEFTQQFCRKVEITNAAIEKITKSTKDADDRHVIASAVESGETMIYTLDYGFFSDAMRDVTDEYGVVSQFPSFDVYEDVENALKNVYDYSYQSARTRSFSGAITLTLNCIWNSLDRQNIDQRWYILDSEGFFGLWYDTKKQACIFRRHSARDSDDIRPRSMTTLGQPFCPHPAKDYDDIRPKIPTGSGQTES